jgi:hexosaminidase
VIEVNSQTITVRAATQTGFFYALQSLRQLLPTNIYAQKFQRKVFWNIPNVRVLDHPRFEYRGMHLDSARHFMPTAQVKRLIDLMAIHKLNYFQWHLTDDEAWRIEIKAYPQLTEKGAWRGFNPLPHDDKFDLFPSFGSGRQSYGGYYTQDDIREIVKYAQERHITIIPEIDLPGHARAMIMSLPQQLIDNSDHSDYTSIQGYKDNVLPACDTNTLSVIDNIMTEVAQLFPANYIHIGGDEVPHGAWEKSPACQKLGFEPLDPNYRDKVQNYFLKQVQMILSKKEKIMAGWEEIASAESTLETPLRVYIWNSSKTAQVYKKAQEKGYEIIQAPAENLYFDLSYNANPKEPGQYWAGYVDTFSAYSFTPVDQTKGQTTELIKGVQGQLWSEQISSLEKLDYFSFPKLAGLAELAWTPVDQRNWHNFYARMVVLHLPRLESYGVNYHDVEFSL